MVPQSVPPPPQPAASPSPNPPLTSSPQVVNVPDSTQDKGRLLSYVPYVMASYNLENFDCSFMSL